MSGHDAELDQFGPGVSCAVLLERATPPWQLDRKGSARRALGARALSRTILLAASEADAVRDGLTGARGSRIAIPLVRSATSRFAAPTSKARSVAVPRPCSG